MKKDLYLLVTLLLLIPLSLRAQSFQPLNGDFEQWDAASLTAEPTHWNSFATSDGTFASLASSPHHYHRNGGRPGSAGSSYLTIYTKSVIGVKANGNMTTGRIHAGSMSATSSDNYNYTQRSNADFSQPFTATPDSVYLWVSFYAKTASSQASFTATIHGDCDYRDPNDDNSPALYAGRAKVEFDRTTSSATQPSWTLLKVPFIYSGTADPAYLLISMTTNKTPGQGDANDSLSIDDIQFIYSAWLTAITLNGTPLSGFSQGTLSYSATVESFDDLQIGYTTEVQDATVAVDYETMNDTLRRYTLVVTAEDGTTQKQYTVDVATSAAGPVAIAEAESPLIRLQPNPATTQVNVQLPADGQRWQLQLVDLQGRIHRTVMAQGICPIDLSRLAVGLYQLRASSPQGQTLVVPLVKQ